MLRHTKGCSAMKAMYLFIHSVGLLGRRTCLHPNLCLHRTRVRKAVKHPCPDSLYGRSVQAVEDNFRSKRWNSTGFVNSGYVRPSFQTIQEIGMYQFSSHRSLTQICPLQIADTQDTVCMFSCSLEMYFRFFKLRLVCIPVAGVATFNVNSIATNATATANTNTDSSNNTAATTTTIFSLIFVNQ